MKRLKKTIRASVAAVLALSAALTLTACNRKDKTVTVRYLNFKPEVASVYRELADAYEKETGVRVIVETAANNKYEETLTSKMAAREAPVLFQINGPRGYANWKDYCADLTDSELYRHLTEKDLAIKGEDGKVYGIPYVSEGYGILYNKAITDKYFALQSKATPYSSMEEINSFKKLSELVTDMQKNKAALGIDGVFASTSLKSGEDWRWQTHLANIPVYYELKDKGLPFTPESAKSVTFEHSDSFRNIFDLYINNSVTDKSALGTKTVTDSMSEFALEKCAMVQNGNWAWSQISEVTGNRVRAENVKMLPIYTGEKGEETQGLCIGTENYYAVNANASKEEQEAAKDFIFWLFSSDMGKSYVTDKLNFIAPFDTFSEAEQPSDPLAQELLRWMKREDTEFVPWIFTLFPSQTFKEKFGASLLRYTQGGKAWEQVKTDMASDWAREANAAT